MRAKRRFSTEEVLALRDEGITISEAAARLGVTRSAVEFRLKREGLSWPRRGRRLDDETFRRFWACHEISTEELARWLGVTRQAVSWRARQLGLPSRKHVRRRKARDEELVELWQAGVCTSEIAAHFGYASRSCVSKRARDLGLPARRRTAGVAGRNGWDGTISMLEFWEERLAQRMREEARGGARVGRRLARQAAGAEGARE